MTQPDALAGIEERLRRLEDERQILRTLHRYGHSIDYGAEEEWLDCFTADGTLDVRRDAPEGARYDGRAPLEAFIRAHTRAPEQYHKHLLIEPQIEVDGEHARSTSYFARLDRTETDLIVRSFGRYRDRLVRCPDLRWRFEERIAEVEARHPSSQ